MADAAGRFDDGSVDFAENLLRRMEPYSAQEYHSVRLAAEDLARAQQALVEAAAADRTVGRLHPGSSDRRHAQELADGRARVAEAQKQATAAVAAVAGRWIDDRITAAAVARAMAAIDQLTSGSSVAAAAAREDLLSRWPEEEIATGDRRRYGYDRREWVAIAVGLYHVDASPEAVRRANAAVNAIEAAREMRLRDPDFARAEREFREDVSAWQHEQHRAELEPGYLDNVGDVTDSAEPTEEEIATEIFAEQHVEEIWAESGWLRAAEAGNPDTWADEDRARDVDALLQPAPVDQEAPPDVVAAEQAEHGAAAPVEEQAIDLLVSWGIARPDAALVVSEHSSHVIVPHPIQPGVSVVDVVALDQLSRSYVPFDDGAQERLAALQQRAGGGSEHRHEATADLDAAAAAGASSMAALVRRVSGFFSSKSRRPPTAHQQSDQPQHVHLRRAEPRHIDTPRRRPRR